MTLATPLQYKFGLRSFFEDPESTWSSENKIKKPFKRIKKVSSERGGLKLGSTYPKEQPLELPHWSLQKPITLDFQ